MNADGCMLVRGWTSKRVDGLPGSRMTSLTQTSLSTTNACIISFVCGVAARISYQLSGWKSCPNTLKLFRRAAHVRSRVAGGACILRSVPGLRDGGASSNGCDASAAPARPGSCISRQSAASGRSQI